MSPKIPYSAAQDDLFNPGRRDGFFSPKPQSDAALCVEMARLAYCRKEPEFGFDQERIQKILVNIGFGPCQFFESLERPQGKGVHCFLAVGPEKKHRLAVVAFRGTDVKDTSNLVYDVDFELEPWDGPGMAHRGFVSALREVYSRLDKAIQEIGECRLLYTGHSLGAAMATLMAGRRQPDALYTFGCPRVGDVAFVGALKNVRTFRYVDCCDLVTRIPLESIGFQHLGEPCYIQRSRKVMLNPSDEKIRRDHLFAVLYYAVQYALWKGNERIRELADHAPINYVWPVKASLP
jgi:triacylglycerol lipase